MVVGRYKADLVVNDAVIVDLKSAKVLMPEHEAQLLNYLRATKYEVGMLFFFGPRPQFRRLIFWNRLKGNTGVRGVTRRKMG